jgi:hypothetical protein
MHNPRVLFTVNSKSFEGTARTVDRFTEHKLAGEIAGLMNTKYGWSDGLTNSNFDVNLSNNWAPLLPCGYLSLNSSYFVVSLYCPTWRRLYR